MALFKNRWLFWVFDGFRKRLGSLEMEMEGSIRLCRPKQQGARLRARATEYRPTFRACEGGSLINRVQLLQFVPFVPFVCLFIPLCMYAFMYVCIYLFMCLFFFFIYSYIYIYIYTYLFMHIFIDVLLLYVFTQTFIYCCFFYVLFYLLLYFRVVFCLIASENVDTAA